jgi:hypothetical protein
MLLNLNTSALSSISTTLEGEARFLEPGSEEESWCKERHLENNTFEEEEMNLFGLRQQQQQQQSGETAGQRRPSMTVDDNARVVTVRVREGRIADWKGGVRDWTIVTDGQEQPAAAPVNGVPSSSS